jgi:hypothetical protein
MVYLDGRSEMDRFTELKQSNVVKDTVVKVMNLNVADLQVNFAKLLNGCIVISENDFNIFATFPGYTMAGSQYPSTIEQGSSTKWPRSVFPPYAENPGEFSRTRFTTSNNSSILLVGQK